MPRVCIQNQIGKLTCALVHRPGAETRNYPEGEFNQIFSLRTFRTGFNLDKALAEHDEYVRVLQDSGVEVLYLDQLLYESIATNDSAYERLRSSFLDECGISGAELLDKVSNYIDRASNPRAFIETLISGIRYRDIVPTESTDELLADIVEGPYPSDALIINPLNTLWFTKDPATVIGGGISLNHMYWHERFRESSIYESIFKYHPRFKGTRIYPCNKSSYHIEGGDIINLDPENVAIGISSRTESSAIDSLSRKLLWEAESTIESVWAITVPDDDLCLHLDNFLNQIDYETFLIDPELYNESKVYRITRGRKENTGKISYVEGGVEAALRQALGLSKLKLVFCGGGSAEQANRERAGNAVGVLCLEAGKLCTYEQNTYTNEALYQSGINLTMISIDELTSGFGGPNCLCLPLIRED